MKKRHKVYLKLNILSLFFIAVSFCSITLAWFAYSGLASTETDINVKAWYIDFQKDNTSVSNNIVISLDEIYPGMDIMSETIDIKNKGDSDAQVSFSLQSVRILDEEINVNDVGMDALVDRLAYDYPFHINVGLSKKVAVSEVGSSELSVSVSWPLDSLNDEADSKWGNDAFEFLQKEKAKKNADDSYQMRSPIKIVISIKAEQFILSDDAIDKDYLLGNTVLYDVALNKRCQQLSSTCIKMNVLDNDNKVGDDKVLLLPTMYNTYDVSSWDVQKRDLNIMDVLPIISQDVMNTYLIRDGLSDVSLGTINNQERVEYLLNLMNDRNGYFKFLSSKFLYFNTSKNVLLEDLNGRSYCMKKIDDTTSKIVIKGDSDVCDVIPVIEVLKENLVV